ncbi:restriction endonuclease subunit S [Rhodococcus qingshengii]|uniref:restriction endonuclease subunit S n=1 Tax=Rhodococcus qingshengii TaxID=334542 RepID=UPI003015C8D0
MSAWPSAPLGDLCTITIGRTPSRSRRDFWGVGLNWLSIADMNQGREVVDTKESITELGARESGSRLIEPGTILLSFKLSIGKVSINRIPLYTNEAIAALSIKDENQVCSEWLYWALRTADLHSGHDRAAMGATLNKAKLLSISIPLPPLSEQRRIAAILDHVDALRAKRREALAQSEQLAQSIFIDMFGEPTTNPEGWDVVRLSELVRDGDKINYGVVQPGEESEGGVPLIRAGDLDGGQFDIQRLRTVAPEVDVRHRRSRLVGDEILVSCVGSIGVVALVSVREQGFNIARAVARIRVGERVHRIFLATYLSTPAVRNYFTSELRTVAQPTLNIKQLEATEVPLPPMAAQEIFVRRILSVDQLRYQQKTAQAELNTLFSALQSRAFRGEL